jgi:outer membrane protein assembly factor BamB
MHKCLNRRAWALAGLLASSAGAAERATWAGWRGPEGQGVSREQGLPVEWSATKNVAWKAALPGHGHSQPVVWGDRIFLTTDVEGEVVRPGAKGVRHVADGQEFVHPDGVGADRRHTLKVLSLNARTGRILWERTVWEGTPYDSRHRKGAYAAATPVVDGQRVISWFGSEGLYAHDFRGRLLWSASVGGIATMGVGVGTSPVLYGDLVILQCDEDNGDRSFIVAFDRETGREAWRAPRRVQVSWGTPVLVRAAGRDELVTTGTEWIIAYEPLTGKGLWRAKGLESNAVPSPVVAGDIVVLSAGYPAKLAMAIRAGGEGDVTASRVLWRYAKGTAYVPSPIAYGDHVYLVTDKGLVTCLDVRTGEVRYEGGRVPVAATFMASPVAYDGRLLLASEDGDVFAIKAGPVHEVLGTSAMGERIAASPAIAGGRIYIRGARHLFAIGAGG